jgi:dipeptidyl aminopeptidase/acylaminoacyl peptidase
MQSDFRGTALYREAETLYETLRSPGSGQISDAVEINAAPDGGRVIFSGAIWDRLIGGAPTRICSADLATGKIEILTSGPNSDRLPKFSPDGQLIAFLSDRRTAGDYQLHILDPTDGAVHAAPVLPEWVEYLHWSPDGRRVLLGTAGHGADISGGQGAIRSTMLKGDTPSWMPSVAAGDEPYRWRRAWVYEPATGQMRQVSDAQTNVWEAVWCGNECIIAVASSAPEESDWYTATVRLIQVRSGEERVLYLPRDQLGWPAASPSGRHLVVVEAICSDRWVVAGDLKFIDTSSGQVRRIETNGIDVTYNEWRSEDRLLLAGHRGSQTVIALYDAASGATSEVWAGQDITTGGRYVTVAGLDDKGDCALVGEGFSRTPEIAAIRAGTYQAIASIPAGRPEHFDAIDEPRCLTWHAPDGLEIQGWLLRPKGHGPFPLVMMIHGGPVGHWRPTWLGRNVAVLMLVKRGYAVFFPNPRGSAGWGQDFARSVYGDIGGADAQDLLSGLDVLVRSGIADPNRLGVTGISYGGFLTSWLITQTKRFAAAVPVAPHTNQVSEHLVSNIAAFMRQVLKEPYHDMGGQYLQRSPVMHAHKAGTPTLNICGALDRCTPPEEAVQFHNALRENGVRSVLIVYPEEGHGVRKLPAAIDYSARLVSWFEQYMPA